MQFGGSSTFTDILLQYNAVFEIFFIFLIYDALFETFSIFLQYNAVFETVVSVDMGGMVECWSGPKTDYAFPKKLMWQYKTDTDLYEFAKVHMYLATALLCIYVLHMSIRKYIKHTGDYIARVRIYYIYSIYSKYAPERYNRL
jgi:hypothetical protein